VIPEYDSHFRGSGFETFFPYDDAEAGTNLADLLARDHGAARPEQDVREMSAELRHRLDNL
jgi:hypothetical protein